MTTKPGPLRHRVRRLAVLVGWTVLASLMLLELVMQFGSLLLWAWSSAPASPAVAGRTVLCIGDSWTHGMGASNAATNSYPAVLQSLLRERAAVDWTVVNCGQSGQNSRDVLERLPGQLVEFRPRWVCVLVGRNDVWTRPDLLPVAASGGGVTGAYRFRWRLPRLWAWVRSQLFPAAPAAPAAARDGPDWQPRVVNTDSPYWQSEPAPWGSDAEANREKQEGWRCLGNKELLAALAHFERALAAVPADRQSRQQLVSLNRQLGRNDAARAHLEWLRQHDAASAGYWQLTTLAQAEHDCGEWQASLAVVERVNQAFPLDGGMWRLRAQNQFALGLVDDAARSVDEALRHDRGLWSHDLRYRIWCLGRHDLDESARSLFACYVVHNDATFVQQRLSTITSPSSIGRLREVLAAFACSRDVRARLARILDDELRSQQRQNVDGVLDAHLARILQACHAAGARTAVLSYPPNDLVEANLRRAAAAHGGTFIEMRREFEQRRGSRPLDDLLAPDGHCNDLGYRLMAEIVADALVPRLGGGGK